MKSLKKEIAVDTGVFVSLLDNKDKHHRACLDCFNSLPQHTKFCTTESCLTETSYLLPAEKQVRQRLGTLLRLLDIEIIPLDSNGLWRSFELMDKYHDLPMDFADATLVAACEKLNVHHVLTLDRRDFSIYRPKHASRFQILPSS